jgi:hypothetical protein
MASGYPYIDVFLLTSSISASCSGLRLPVWRLRRRSRALVLLWPPSGDVVVTSTWKNFVFFSCGKLSNVSVVQVQRTFQKKVQRTFQKKCGFLPFGKLCLA